MIKLISRLYSYIKNTFCSKDQSSQEQQQQESSMQQESSQKPKTLWFVIVGIIAVLVATSELSIMAIIAICLVGLALEHGHKMESISFGSWSATFSPC